MRVTRATSRAEHAHHAADASIPHADQDRVPLGEVSANTILDPEPMDAPAKKMVVKKEKARSTAKKGAKGKKAKAADEDADDMDATPAKGDDLQAEESPVSDEAVDELAKEPTAGACSQHFGPLKMCY